jgi:ABC-type dipeptide/oligopeptide/nickel transport system permease component
VGAGVAGSSPRPSRRRCRLVGALFGVSLPGFWFGILLIGFAGKLRWLPVSGRDRLRASRRT